MELYCPCWRKITSNLNKEWDFPLMKVESVFCVKCGVINRDIKHYKFNPYGKAKVLLFNI